MKQDKAASRAERIGEMTHKKREEEKKAEEERVLAYVNKIMKVKQKRNEASKSLKDSIIRPDRDHKERLADIKKAQ